MEDIKPGFLLKDGSPYWVNLILQALFLTNEESVNKNWDFVIYHPVIKYIVDRQFGGGVIPLNFFENWFW